MSLVLRYDRATLVIEPDGEAEGGALALGKAGGVLEGLGFVPDPRIAGRYRGHAHHYRALLVSLSRAGVGVKDEARAYAALGLTHRRERQPYPHQGEAVAAWEAAGRRGVVVLPTGSGKSYVAELIIAKSQRSTLVVVPTIDLMHQWAQNLSLAFDEDEVGLIGGGQHEQKKITVTTYDSAHLHVERLGAAFGLVVFDECHHLPSPAYAQGAEGLIAPFRLGLTATPERQDGAEGRLDALIGPVVYRRDIQDLSGQYLAPYETNCIRVSLDEEERVAYDTARATYRAFVDAHQISMGRRDGWGTFLQLAARSEAGREALLAWRRQRQIALGCRAKLQVLEQLLRQHRDEAMIIFTADNDTVYQISKTWLIPALTHETPAADRKKYLAAFNDGQLHALVTTRVLNEGVDLPRAQVGIVLAGTATVREHVQRLGRILRKQGDKAAILYEVITADTSEERVSTRRREHGAYQR